MMKSTLRRLLFLPITFGLLLVLQPGAVFAAPTQTHQARQSDAITNQNGCSASNTNDLVIASDYGWGVDCFSTPNSGTENVAIYNVSALETGGYYVTYTWLDYNGGSHTSTKSPWTFLSAGDAAANAFAGAGTIAEITRLQIGAKTPLVPTNCIDVGQSDIGTFMATNTLGSTAYWTDCFSSLGTHSVGLDGVYAIDSGYYNLAFTWKDYNGGIHHSTIPRRTFLAAGNANGGNGGFVGSNSIDQITSITLS